MSDGDHRSRSLALSRVVVRPVASPLPLGLMAFGTGVVLTSAYDLGWLGGMDARSIAIFLVAFVGPLELIPAVFAFLARDVVAATTLGIFGATWITVGAIQLEVGFRQPVESVAFFYLVASVWLLFLAAAGWMDRPAFALVLLFAIARFVLSAIQILTGSATVQSISGGVGIALAVMAAYAALAILLEDVRQRAILPITRRRAAELAFEGDLADQLARVDQEAGVRRQL